MMQDADVTSPSTGERYRIQAIERAVAILGAFSAEEPELRVADLAERLNLHKSTVHRFLVNLERAGMVERSPRSSRYRLGLRLFELGSLVVRRMDLWDEALPFLEAVSATTALSIPSTDAATFSAAARKGSSSCALSEGTVMEK